MTSAKTLLFLKIESGSKKRQQASKLCLKHQILSGFRANYYRISRKRKAKFQLLHCYSSLFAEQKKQANPLRAFRGEDNALGIPNGFQAFPIAFERNNSKYFPMGLRIGSPNIPQTKKRPQSISPMPFSKTASTHSV